MSEQNALRLDEPVVDYPEDDDLPVEDTVWCSDNVGLAWSVISSTPDVIGTIQNIVSRAARAAEEALRSFDFGSAVARSDLRSAVVTVRVAEQFTNGLAEARLREQLMRTAQAAHVGARATADEPAVPAAQTSRLLVDWRSINESASRQPILAVADENGTPIACGPPLTVERWLTEESDE